MQWMWDVLAGIGTAGNHVEGLMTALITCERLYAWMKSRRLS